MCWFNHPSLCNYSKLQKYITMTCQLYMLNMTLHADATYAKIGIGYYMQ